MNLPKTVFVGHANSPVCWYRCALPARTLGCDWAGVGMPLDKPQLYNGNIDEFPNLFEYEVVILQQPNSHEDSYEYWNNAIIALQAKGIKVLYEIDDFVHGIRKIEFHMNQKEFHKKRLKEFQYTMGICDGLICSTAFLASQYSKYNKNAYICEVGIDTERYAVEFPDRGDYIVIGWSGGSGHDMAVGPWLIEIAKVIQTYDNVYFTSIGTNYGQAINEAFKGKGLTVPWIHLDNLPYALTNFDLYIAPTHDSKYFKSKSNLRWLEGSAVGLPGVVNPQTYFDAEDYATALFASTPEDAGDAIIELIESKDLRSKIGRESQKHVQEHFDISKKAENWRNTILDIVK